MLEGRIKMSYLVCTITGHRPQRFKFKYNERYKLCIKIKRALCTEIKNLYVKGVRTFWIGGSMGVDTWAAEIMIELKKQKEYKDLRLCVALPFPGFKERFDPKQQTRLRDILLACDELVTTSNHESEKAYRIRNQYMIDYSDGLLAVYDNNCTIRSGTGMTVSYAKKNRLFVILIHPDTAEISQDTSCSL